MAQSAAKWLGTVSPTEECEVPAPKKQRASSTTALVGSTSADRQSIIYAPFSRGPRISVQWAIEGRDQIYLLRAPFAVDLEYLDDGTVFASHRDIPVHGYGRDVGEALRAFDDMFDSQWRNLANVDDARLTEHARDVRAALRAVVESVRQLPRR